MGDGSEEEEDDHGVVDWKLLKKKMSPEIEQVVTLNFTVMR